MIPGVLKKNTEIRLLCPLGAATRNWPRLQALRVIYIPTRMRWASASEGGRWRMITPEIVLLPAGASQGEGEEAAPTNRPFTVFQSERLNHKPYVCTVPAYDPPRAQQLDCASASRVGLAMAAARRDGEGRGRGGVQEAVVAAAGTTDGEKREGVGGAPTALCPAHGGGHGGRGGRRGGKGSAAAGRLARPPPPPLHSVS